MTNNLPYLQNGSLLHDASVLFVWNCCSHKNHIYASCSLENITRCHISCILCGLSCVTVADPGFPVGGLIPIEGDTDVRRGCFSMKTCAKMKELGPVWGRGAGGVPLDPPLCKIITKSTNTLRPALFVTSYLVTFA